MELLGDVGHGESCFRAFGVVLVSMQDRCMRLKWMLKWMRLKWMLVLIRLGIVQILTQDRCMVCAKRTMASEIIWDVPNGTPR
jgi:hypothetical protein